MYLFVPELFQRPKMQSQIPNPKIQISFFLEFELLMKCGRFVSGMVWYAVVWCDGEGYIQPRCDVIMIWYEEGVKKSSTPRIC